VNECEPLITGTTCNPLAVLARQLDIQCHNIRDTCPLYTVGGAAVDPDVDSRIQDMHNSLLDELNDYREEMDAAAAGANTRFR
jgi:hypothetical protein